MFFTALWAQKIVLDDKKFFCRPRKRHDEKVDTLFWPWLAILSEVKKKFDIKKKLRTYHEVSEKKLRDERSLYKNKTVTKKGRKTEAAKSKNTV